MENENVCKQGRMVPGVYEMVLEHYNLDENELFIIYNDKVNVNAKPTNPMYFEKGVLKCTNNEPVGAYLLASLILQTVSVKKVAVNC